MYGAILGDMIGAPYEFDRGEKTKDFPLFIAASQFTDDTVMTIAVAEALLDAYGADDDAILAALTASMQLWGRNTQMLAMEVCLENGCALKILCRIIASGMVPPCGWLQLGGCMTPLRRPDRLLN